MESQDPELKAELTALRQRVERLERRAGLAAAPAAAPKPAAAVAVRPAAASSERGDAGKVLGVVAVVCFVLAASFLIKLAIDSGWLTPERQLGLATILGMALVGGGLGLPRRGDPYLSLVPATGVVILYMSAYAGSLYYGFYGSGAAALLASGVSVLAVALSREFDNEFFLLGAVVGTYLSALLLPAIRGASFDSMLFFLAWDAAFAYVASRFNSRTTLLLACYLAIGAFAATSPTVLWRASPADLLSAAAFQFLQFVLFCGSAARFSVAAGKPMTVSEAWAFFPVLLFFYGTEYSLVERLSHQAAPWMALCFAAFLYAVYASARSRLAKDALESEPIVNAFVAVVLFHAAYLELLPPRLGPWLGVALLALAVPLSRSLDLRGRHWPFGAAIAAVIGIGLLKSFFGLGVPDAEELCALDLAYAALLLGAYALAPAGKPASAEEDLRLFVVIAATAEALAALHRLVHDLLAGPYERFAVTLLWAGFGMGLLLWAENRRDQRLARCAVLVLAAAGAKGLLFDVSGHEPVVRIVCLLLLGSVLYVSGFLLRRAASWAKS